MCNIHSRLGCQIWVSGLIRIIRGLDIRICILNISFTLFRYFGHGHKGVQHPGYGRRCRGGQPGVHLHFQVNAHAYGQSDSKKQLKDILTFTHISNILYILFYILYIQCQVMPLHIFKKIAGGCTLLIQGQTREKAFTVFSTK